MFHLSFLILSLSLFPLTLSLSPLKILLCSPWWPQTWGHSASWILGLQMQDTATAPFTGPELMEEQGSYRVMPRALVVGNHPGSQVSPFFSKCPSSHCWRLLSLAPYCLQNTPSSPERLLLTWWLDPVIPCKWCLNLQLCPVSLSGVELRFPHYEWIIPAGCIARRT